MFLVVSKFLWANARFMFLVVSKFLGLLLERKILRSYNIPLSIIHYPFFIAHCLLRTILRMMLMFRKASG